MKFAINIVYACFSRWTDVVADITKIAADPRYAKLSNSRPLLYFFAADGKWISHFGSPDEARVKFDALRDSFKHALGENPYLVLFAGNPAKSAALAKTLGMDAISLYADWVGEGQREVPFSDYKTHQENTIRSFSKVDYPFVPLIATGWDTRPEIDYGARYGIGKTRDRRTSWTAKPTADDLRAATLALLTEYRSSVACKNQVGTAVIYAWNELSEGGWLVPTIGEGRERLQGLGSALNDLSKQAAKPKKC
jgi:hypothetical protein